MKRNDYVIIFKDVSKSFGKIQALKRINLSIPNGSIYGLLGPNGAGKTTILRIITRVLAIDEGNLVLLGNTHDIYPKDIGVVFDFVGEYERLTAYENLSFFGSLYQLPDLKNRINEILEIFDLKDQSDKRVSTFSFGMKKRLSLCRALIHNPKLLILDEPTSGLDPLGQSEVQEYLLKIFHKERKRTVIIASHNLNEIFRICSHFAIIKKGEISIDGVKKELVKNVQELEKMYISIHKGSANNE